MFFEVSERLWIGHRKKETLSKQLQILYTSDASVMNFSIVVAMAQMSLIDSTSRYSLRADQMLWPVNVSE